MKRVLSATVLALSLYLGLYNEYLALWDSGRSTPVKIYPYQISVYSKIDKSTLEKGIKITSDAQLSQLLDDFLS